MNKSRLEAFSDGVLAIIITIMVLEIKAPQGADWATLKPLLPVFLSYVLSFVFVGIYWGNHHHLLHTIKRVNSKMIISTGACLLAISMAFVHPLISGILFLIQSSSGSSRTRTSNGRWSTKR